MEIFNSCKKVSTGGSQLQRYRFATIKCIGAGLLSLSASIALAEYGSAATPQQSERVGLSIESWRSEDAQIWNNRILPEFQKKYPHLDIRFSPTKATEYNAALNAKLEGETAGDLITCRPFDPSLELFRRGHLLDLSDLEGLDHFGQVAKSAWSTDDGTKIFCVPIASVIHGFIYNKDVFDRLGIQIPETESEFLRTLELIRTNTSLIPLALGTKDQWEAATVGLNLVGPNYWLGETGRRNLITGIASFTDPEFVEAFRALDRLRPFLGYGYQAQSYSDSQSLFVLERAAIYPGGSWEITGFQQQANFELGVFAAPKPSNVSKCFLSDHTDIGIGINASSPNQEQAKLFLTWLTTSEFANIITNELPGFFSNSNHSVDITNPLAREFVRLREHCEPTIRIASQILSRGTPPLSNALWTISAGVLNGRLSPEEAARQAQSSLARAENAENK